ncbi:MAG: 3-methyl-2-oxobutanoate hydroxymethyltransferase [Bacillales bacterium]|jgi:3-methyl-2-oxobutanoate hydroxymethyltransferase|nr:3-methyl-2-oxobutanoate hydroxymethyltransferase [Bacillales bacterium]
MKTVTDFYKMKENAEKISMITAYDFPSAKLVEKSGADILLVGDSLGMVVLGYDSTVPVTMDDMIHHSKAARRGAPNTFIVSDMPFGSYHISDSDTVRNSARFLQESNVNAIKLEGPFPDKIKLLTAAGIPVVAHLGLTPQSVGILGGYKVQGKTASDAEKIMNDSIAVQEAGAIMLVLECVPKELSAHISKKLHIPVIGIGAGVDTDGQVLVYHDIIQYGIDRTAKFVKTYANVNAITEEALTHFVNDVKSGEFPSNEHSFKGNKDELGFLYGGK